MLSSDREIVRTYLQKTISPNDDESLAAAEAFTRIAIQTNELIMENTKLRNHVNQLVTAVGDISSSIVEAIKKVKIIKP